VLNSYDMSYFIDIENLVFEYIEHDEEGHATGVKRAVDDVSLGVEKGQFIAILGHNGSGKSTLAKHLNALLFPGEGRVLVCGLDTKDEENTLKVRQQVGMVFQNPDNQIIASVVEEDVAFGPENLGIPSPQVRERVEESLRIIGMTEYMKHSPNHLSGGQKQRIAIAGVLAMHPDCIIFDESTAMLDPAGRKEVIRCARALNEVENITIILITHYMDEIVHADKVFVMNEGRVVMQGTPREVFSNPAQLSEVGLELPVPARIAEYLRNRGINLPSGILTSTELIESLKAFSLREKVAASAAG
ncbi:MAG: energy-coupling factor transporter ATPase, partial [Bacteroidales bacterium]|nr:energy-coupling factor transporter ATPase [Bacteroidales bacterium]